MSSMKAPEGDTLKKAINRVKLALKVAEKAAIIVPGAAAVIGAVNILIDALR